MNKTELRQYAGSITYNKGLEIYNSNNKILNFEVAKTDDSDYVHASVKGSRGNYYGVSLDIDWDFETI